MSNRKQELRDEFPWLRHKAIVTDDLRRERFDVSRGDSGWWLDGVTFHEVDFSRLDLEGFSAIGSEFVECDFSRTKLKQNVTLGRIHFAESGGDQRPTIYRRCVFDRADLVAPRGHSTVVGAARFENCSFAGARISNLRATNAEFVGCRFEGRLYACKFFGRDPDHDYFHPDQPLQRPTNAFADNDFRNADPVACHFLEGIDVTAQHWPADPDYLIITDVQAALDRVNAAIDALDDPGQQATARFAIDLCFDLVDPRVQTTQVVRLSDLQTDDDTRLAQTLSEALRPPSS